MEGTDNDLSTSSTVRRSESFRHFFFQDSFLSTLQACVLQSDVFLSITLTSSHTPEATMAQQPLADQGLLIIEASRSHTHTTLTRTARDEWSAPHRNLYLTKHNTHNRQTAMLPAGFEPSIPVSQRPHTLALDLLLTATLYNKLTNFKKASPTHAKKCTQKLCVVLWY
jgi:hypothetical protein